MKHKSILVIIGILLAGLPSVYAESDITGDIFGKMFSTMSMADAAIPYGVSIDDINSEEGCDNANQTCLLKGFSWSDVVGWTTWDGTGLQTELGGTDNFPDSYKARTTYKGSLQGFIWGDKFGWVQLSSCSGMDQPSCNAKSYCTWNAQSYCEVDKSKTHPMTGEQTQADWGVYIDFCPLKPNQTSCESAESTAYCNWNTSNDKCVYDSVASPKGQPLRGYAWSQYLGWIKFSPENGESDFNGAYTTWYPDVSPPEIDFGFSGDGCSGNSCGCGADPVCQLNAAALGTDKVWIPNEDPLGTIRWTDFAKETDSKIDTLRSSITVNRDPGQDFVGCLEPGPQGSQNNGNSYITQKSTGEIDLALPQIGLVGLPPYGFCKYTLGGVIYNSSGFGYYFGDEGKAAATVDGVNIDDPKSPFQPTPVKLFVRAGNFSPLESDLDISPGSVIGDGNDPIQLTFSPKDNAGNPIIAVRSSLVPGQLPEEDSNKWVRDVQTSYDLSSSEYYFDRIDPFLNDIYRYPPPVIIEGQTYLYDNPLMYPPSGLLSQLHMGGNYQMNIFGYAPTTFAGNKLELNQLKLATIDTPLPAVSSSMGPWMTSSQSNLDATTPLPGNSLPYLYTFKPALEVASGKLDSDFLVPGQPVKATFNLIKNSDDPILYAVDHVLKFGGIGKQVLELGNINLEGLNDEADRTDPIEGHTRYGLLSSLDPSIGATENNTPFHSVYQNFHAPQYNFASQLNAAGTYTAEGKYIDRTDFLNLAPNAGGGSFSFDFTPTQYIGDPLNTQVTFGINQLLAYHPQNSLFDQFALYKAPDFIDSVEVKSLGIGTKGLVSGGQIFETVGGRNLDILSSTSATDLRKEIRKNVASLTRNINPCHAPLTLVTLSLTPGGCVSVDQENKQVVAVYSGPGSITLASNADIPVPTGFKYTLILTNGANLYLASNITYDENDDASSLGIMVMEDATGQGGNVFVSPVPTNLVGLLYAEGSLHSASDANGGETFYYGDKEDARDLKNQLFWQGAIASRNTIGGSASKTIPKGADCSPWNDDLTSCSMAYDLDFLRRFTTIHAELENVNFAPAGYKFSGGGECNPAAASNPGCSLGPLPTTVKLTTNGNSIDVAASKSLDTVFVERVNRPIPPGFSVSGGLTSSQEIR